MKFGFKMLNPLITERLKEDTGSKELIRYSVLFNKMTGETTTEIENENGKSVGSGKIDMAETFKKFPGSFIKRKLETNCPEAKKILLSMDYTNKVLDIIYLTEDSQIIIHNKHQ